MHVAYKRVLLKLSGEVFGGGEVGLDLDVINATAGEVAEVAKSGVQIAIVVGGGKFFPGAELPHRGMERAGAGMPFFSTDTVAAQRALETRCEVILMGKQGVDGVYDSDPKTNPDAVKFDGLSYDEYLARDLKVADATGIAMARDNRMDIVFFNLSTPGNIVRAVRGEKIGTLVSSSA